REAEHGPRSAPDPHAHRPGHRQGTAPDQDRYRMNVTSSRKEPLMNPTLAPSPPKIAPDQVHETIAKRMLADGFDFVLDLEKSEGVYIYDSRHGKRLLDFFSFFATNPVGMNHPGMKTPEFTKKLLRAALHNPSNSDVYTVEMAEFVETFGSHAMP